MRPNSFNHFIIAGVIAMASAGLVSVNDSSSARIIRLAQMPEMMRGPVPSVLGVPDQLPVGTMPTGESVDGANAGTWTRPFMMQRPGLQDGTVRPAAGVPQDRVQDPDRPRDAASVHRPAAQQSHDMRPPMARPAAGDSQQVIQEGPSAATRPESAQSSPMDFFRRMLAPATQQETPVLRAAPEMRPQGSEQMMQMPTEAPRAPNTHSASDDVMNQFRGVGMNPQILSDIMAELQVEDEDDDQDQKPCDVIAAAATEMTLLIIDNSERKIKAYEANMDRATSVTLRSLWGKRIEQQEDREEALLTKLDMREQALEEKYGCSADADL